VTSQPPRKEAAEEIARAIADRNISYRKLERMKREVSQKYGCDTPSNNEIFKIARKLNSTALEEFLGGRGAVEFEPVDVNGYRIKISENGWWILSIFFILLIYFTFFININFFYNWDILADAICMKGSDFNLLKHFGAAHMLNVLLAYIFASLVSPFAGWDPLLGHKILAALCASGAGTLLYIIVYDLNKNRIHALIATALLCGTYGYITLTLECDNGITNSFFNVLFIFMFLNLIGELKTFEQSKYFINRGLFTFLCGISLGLAVASHLRSSLLIFLVPAIFYFQRETKFSQNVKEVALVVLGSVAVLGSILIINAYAYNWQSIYDLIGFFDIPYYHDPNLFYFAGESRDFAKQLELVNYGLTSLLFQRYQFLLSQNPGFFAYSKVLSTLLGLLLFAYIISSIKSKTTQAMLIIILAGLPEAIFHNAWNIERWDYFLVPLAVLIGNSLARPRTDAIGVQNEKLGHFMDVFMEYRTAIAAIVVLLLFITSICSFNALSHFQENPVFNFADGVDSYTVENSLIVVDIRMTSESGLYLDYQSEREIVSVYDVPVDVVATYINTNLSVGRSIYATSYSLYYLLQSGYEFQYSKVWSNSYCDLYRVYLA